MGITTSILEIWIKGSPYNTPQETYINMVEGATIGSSVLDVDWQFGSASGFSEAIGGYHIAEIPVSWNDGIVFLPVNFTPRIPDGKYIKAWAVNTAGSQSWIQERTDPNEDSIGLVVPPSGFFYPERGISGGYYPMRKFIFISQNHR